MASDFQGPYYVGDQGRMAFGNPTRALKIDVSDIPGRNISSKMCFCRNTRFLSCLSTPSFVVHMQEVKHDGTQLLKRPTLPIGVGCTIFVATIVTRTLHAR